MNFSEETKHTQRYYVDIDKKIQHISFPLWKTNQSTPQNQIFLSIHPNVIQVDRKTVSQNILQQDNQNYKPSASYMSFLIRFSPTLNIQKSPDFPTKHTLHTIMFYVILLYICICSPHLIIISNLAVLRYKFFQCYTTRHEENSSPPQASQQRLVPVDESTLYTKNFHPCVCVTLATKILCK